MMKRTWQGKPVYTRLKCTLGCQVPTFGQDLARTSRSGVRPVAFALPGPFHLDASFDRRKRNVGGIVIDLDREKKDTAESGLSFDQRRKDKP